MKKTIARDEEVIFKNWTDRDFTQTYDHGAFGGKDGKQWFPRRKAYTFKAGKSYYVPFYLAELSAKNIADREYTTAFNAKLTEVKGQLGNTLDRATIEHRVQTSPEVSKLSHQEMMDKCVEQLPENMADVEIVKPEEVKMREVLLHRDERGAEIKEKYPDVQVQVNQKAIDQKEEFEN